MMNLLPTVKSMKTSDGVCDLFRFSKFSCAGLNREALSQVRQHFPEVSITSKKTGFFAQFTAESKGLSAADAGKGFDAFVIQVTPAALRIDARCASGLFYGLQTLFQMGSSPRCGELRDEAAIRYRMIHWDLKGYQPKISVFKDELRILASFKVNAILLEIEDKYDYRCAPGVGVKNAYTFENMREISRLAKDLNIMIVPKLQSIAHVDYLLKHARYKDLRENNHAFQYCLTNPKGLKLWNDMANELMECFAEHDQYFHIGADEAINLGECPSCQKLGKAGSYIFKVQKSIECILAAGRTPIMWDDIIRNSDASLTDEERKQCQILGNKAVLMYWAYGYGGNNNTFPHVSGYLAQGFKVWGASGFSGCDNWVGSIPPLSVRALNLDAWAKTAVEQKLECVCATGWGRIASADCPTEPHECCWFTILYAAQTMWAGKHYDYMKFVYALSLHLYGNVPDDAVAAAIMAIDKNPIRTDALASFDFTDKRYKLLCLCAAAESLAGELKQLCSWNMCYFGRLGKVMPDYRIAYMNRWPVIRAQKMAKLKEEIAPLLREFYEDSTVEDFLVSRFGYIEKLYADTARLTGNTKEC